MLCHIANVHFSWTFVTPGTNQQNPSATILEHVFTGCAALTGLQEMLVRAEQGH